MKKLQIVLLVLLIGIINLGTAQTLSKSLNPPANLKAEHILEEPDVYLTWWAPGTPFWLHYDTGNYANSVGLTDPGEFEVAIAYEPDQLTPYVGMGITKFAFTPSDEASTYIFKIWTGDLADSIIYQDTLSGLYFGDWNTITLDSAIVIEANRLYFFGYHLISQGGSPVGIDEGPTAVPGRSDLIRVEAGPWYSLFDLGIDANINLQIYLEPSAEAKHTPVAIRDFNTCTGVKLSSIKLESRKDIIKFQNDSKAETVNSFNIYRNNVTIGTSTEPQYHDVLKQGGIYTYAVSAVYNSGESDKSESVEVIYDTNRIPVNVVVTEAFINVGMSYDDPALPASPGSPGVFKGIFELNFEVDKIASINYHSATNILGYDEFATEFSEVRFMTYFLRTWAFPLANFNGDMFVGGGSDETLYDAYRPVYDQALNRLTPIALECSLEKTSGVKYLLHANATMVGVYQTKDLVLHIVLTRDSLPYEWNNGKIKQVNYVATGMFPNAEGASISFDADGTAAETVEIEIDPFADIKNYRVVSFIQDTTTFQILNSTILKIPQKRAVTFTVLDGNNPIENASISVNGSTLITDNQGKSAINLWDNQGEVPYIITKNGYLEHSGIFNMDTTKQVTVNLLTNGISNEENLSAQVYPNPVNGNLYVVSNYELEATIYDVSGKKVLTVAVLNNVNTVDVSSLEKGIYFLRIQSEGRQASYKFIKE